MDIGLDSVLQFGEPSAEKDLMMFTDEYDEFSCNPTAFIVNK